LPRARREKQRNASGGVRWLTEPVRARRLTTGERKRAKYLSTTHVPSSRRGSGRGHTSKTEYEVDA
jgi:hypothetical protein